MLYQLVFCFQNLLSKKKRYFTYVEALTIMKLFDEHFLLRILLIVVGTLFSVFMDDLIAFEAHPYWIIPYCASVTFLFFTALFYRFPPSISLNKIRKDLEVPDPSTNMGLVQSDGLQRALEEKESLLNMFFSHSSDGFWVFDLPTGKVQWSARAAELLGVPLEELGTSLDSLRSLIFESDWTKFSNMLSISLESKQKFSLDARPILGKNIIAISGIPQLNAEGRPIRLFGSFVPKADILSFKNPFFLDELTGLKNRRYFLEHLKEKVSYSELHQDYSFALLLIDIDHFGRINDVYSPQFGDCVLKLIAERIVSSCHSQDCVARISADIFGILLHDVPIGKDKSELVEFVQSLHSKIRQPLQLEGKELLIGASMSVILNRDLDASEDLMSHATTLLRNLKSGDCRGNIQFFSGGLREKAMQVYQLEYELRKAIQAKAFTLVYQPVVDIEHGNRVVSFESLVRWNNSERGMIPPSEFIPIAEETGLIVPLGELILRGACRQAKEWVDLGYSDLRIAVNFSAKQFSQGDLVKTLQSILAETGLNPRNLKMEITEYTVMNDAEKTIEMMRQLTAMGVEISIDDFGTGFSSLSYLKNFPVHTLKIDKFFVDSAVEKEEDAAFVRMIIGIAKSLNLELIAEGVETKEQLEFLRSEGCSMIQGYYFSKPLPPAEVLTFLQHSNGLNRSSSIKQLA